MVRAFPEGSDSPLEEKKPGLAPDAPAQEKNKR